jgi:hypothetical protein
MYTTETYTRVIPRDFFNEAKLLKCMGQLALKILDNQTPCKIIIEESGDPFDINLSDDGCLFISNYTVLVKEQEIMFKTTYNSKSAYPFYAEIDYCDYEVFDEKGEFTQEFINMCNTL